ncbi:hypothetical protein CLOP_g20630 [Closterium sp. NIES-67]|nr:hypothetical protein CLOP_g20630 [Closterium sp. NIES-67]
MRCSCNPSRRIQFPSADRTANRHLGNRRAAGNGCIPAATARRERAQASCERPVASPLGATILSTLSSARGLQLAAVVDGNPRPTGEMLGRWREYLSLWSCLW